MEYYLVLTDDEDCSQLQMFDVIHDPNGDSVLWQVIGFAGDGYLMDPIRNTKNYNECLPLAKDIDSNNITEFSRS